MFPFFATATLKLHHLFQGYAVGKVDPLDENVSKSLALQSPTEPIRKALLYFGHESSTILRFLEDLSLSHFVENWPISGSPPLPARYLPFRFFSFQAFRSHETMVLLKRKLNRIPATWDQETFGNGMCKVPTKLQVPQFYVCVFMEIGGCSSNLKKIFLDYRWIYIYIYISWLWSLENDDFVGGPRIGREPTTIPPAEA